MTIQDNVPLRSFNTFGVQANARLFTDINREEDLAVLFADEQLKSLPQLVLGGGSNMLFTNDFDGLVVHMNIHGVSNRVEGDDVYVTAGGGVVWNDLVNYTVDNEFSCTEYRCIWGRADGYFSFLPCL